MSLYSLRVACILVYLERHLHHSGMSFLCRQLCTLDGVLLVTDRLPLPLYTIFLHNRWDQQNNQLSEYSVEWFFYT
jgi:hypothetical protein